MRRLVEVDLLIFRPGMRTPRKGVLTVPDLRWGDFIRQCVIVGNFRASGSRLLKSTPAALAPDASITESSAQRKDDGRA